MENTQEKYPNLISAEVVADSLNQFGERITTMKLVFPRFILAELNTHRMFNRNSASSRAIPFKKMVKEVMERPSIPIAWQKDHKGMQGNEYFQSETGENVHKLIEGWLDARNSAVQIATGLNNCNVTKQLCNRLLEPFMWHTVLVTATEWENFFELRNPVYEWEYEEGTIKAKSKEEFLEMFIQRYPTNGERDLHDWEAVDENFNPVDSNFWRSINKGQAEIHMMALAESIYDAVNESTPKQLEVGQWHIPFGDNIPNYLLLETFGLLNKKETEDIKLKISVARCARISYETLGDNPVIDYKKDIELHDTLLAIKHMSPFEHCAVVMEEEEYIKHIKTSSVYFEDSATLREGVVYNDLVVNDSDLGWSRNLKGFKQYREFIE